MQLSDARSLLFVPATATGMLQKALQRGADAIIIDLEDGVATERKAEARGLAADAIADLSGRVPLLVRVNSAPDLLAGLAKLEKTGLSVAVLHDALEASGAAIAVLLERALSGDGRIKGFKPHAGAFLGYLISHESHHRGQIVLTLKGAGFPVDKKTAFGLWEWGVR